MLRGEKHDFVVSCDECGSQMYRVRSGRIGSVYAERMTIPPIALTLSGKRELVFCSTTCVGHWFDNAGRGLSPDLTGGYPLYWGANPEPPLESRRPTDDRGGSS